MGKRLVVIAALAAALAAVAVSPASAASVDCSSSGGVLTGPVNGNVIVPSGVSCLVVGAHVAGSVQVQPRGSLTLLGSQVDRNLQATMADWLLVGAVSAIGRNVRIVGTTGAPPGLGASSVCLTVIGGSLMLSGNSGAFQIGCGEARGNDIGKALISGNTGQVTFQYNHVVGTAMCSGNVPAIVGTGNTAGRNLGCF